MAKLAAVAPTTAGALPNIITPNSNGLNDAFYLPGLPPGTWQLRVFSRWGRQMYQADDYRQDWSATGLPDGVYYCQLRAEGQSARRG